jgi:hypothetical protein
VSAYPDGNPKTSAGAQKVPLHLVPPSATHYLALAFKDGAQKYGPYNWRDKGVSASVYYAAAKRHLDAFWDGEDASPDAGVHHFAHVMACCAIVLDALTVGKLNDDRPPAGATPRLQFDYAASATPGVVREVEYAHEAPVPPALAALMERQADEPEGLKAGEAWEPIEHDGYAGEPMEHAP